MVQAFVSVGRVRTHGRRDSGECPCESLLRLAVHPARHHHLRREAERPDRVRAQAVSEIGLGNEVDVRVFEGGMVGCLNLPTRMLSGESAELAAAGGGKAYPALLKSAIM